MTMMACVITSTPPSPPPVPPSDTPFVNGTQEADVGKDGMVGWEEFLLLMRGRPGVSVLMAECKASSAVSGCSTGKGRYLLFSADAEILSFSSWMRGWRGGGGGRGEGGGGGSSKSSAARCL